MININFNLRSKDETKPIPIIAILRWSGKKMSYSTGERVLLKNWNIDKQAAKAEGSSTINHNLRKLRRCIEEVYDTLRKDEIPEPHSLKKSVKIRMEGGNEESISLAEYMDQFIEERSLTKTYNTMKTYKTTRRIFNEFQSYKKRSYDFRHIDISFCEDFKEYMINLGKAPNYINKILQILKTIMRNAKAKDLHDNSSFESSYFRMETTPTKEYIYLSENELDRIAALALEGRMAKARDSFLMLCYTGFRYSDYYHISKSNVIQLDSGVRGLKIRMSKTNTEVVVPIIPKMEKLLEKYDWDVPKIYSNQKMNNAIKSIAEQAGIDDDLDLVKFGNKKQKTIIRRKKYEEIFVHTARRSFASNAYYHRGLDIFSISKLLGHASVKTTQSYLKVSNEDIARKAAVKLIAPPLRAII